MRTRFSCFVLAAAGLIGCGSSSPTTLNYTNPVHAQGWQLVKDPASTSSRLVLDLVGPSGVKTRGVGFNLTADSSVRFLAFDGGVPAEDTGVYHLNAAQRDPTLPADIVEPTFFAAGVKDNNLLTVGIFQKDRTVDAVDSSVPVLRIALGLAPGVKPGAILLQVVKAKFMPADIGGTTDSIAILNKSQLVPAEVSVGTLQAN